MAAPRPAPRSFTTLYDEALLDVSITRDLTGQDLKLLFHLISVMEFGNWVHVSQRTIAEKMSTRQSNIWRSLQKLEDQGLVKQQQKGSKVFYRVSPRIAFRGSQAAYHDARRDFGLDYKPMMFEASPNGSEP